MQNRRNLNLIICVDPNYGIGINNRLPWSIKNDLEHFKKLTLNQEIVMGRKTWDSLGNKPLKSRKNIVIHKGYTLDDWRKERAIISENKGVDSVEEWVIGGDNLISQLDKEFNRVVITITKTEYKCDTFITSPIIRNLIDCIKIIFLGFTDTGITRDYTNNRYRIEKIADHKECVIFDCVWADNPNPEEKQIIDTLHRIVNYGVDRSDRTGVGRRSVFGATVRFDLSDNRFPLQTIKKVSFKNLLGELMWIIRGQTNSKILEADGNMIWKPNSSVESLKKRGLEYKEGDVGPLYGFQLRHWGDNYIGCDTKYQNGIDQLTTLIKNLKEDPYSSRHILSYWNVSDLDKMAIPPCVSFIQFYVEKKEDGNYLNTHYFQRSNDVGVAMGWNVSSVALLNILIASVTGYKSGTLMGSITDVHIYCNHNINDLFLRVPFEYPKLYILNKKENIEDYDISDFSIIGYKCYPSKKLALNV